MEDRENKIKNALKKIRRTYNVNESKVSARRTVYNTKLSELIKDQTFVENKRVKKAVKKIIKNVILGDEGEIYNPDFDLFIHKIKKVPAPRRFETKERKTRVTQEEFIYVVEFSSNDNNFFHNKYCIRVEELDEVKIVDGEEEDLGNVNDADSDYEVVVGVNDDRVIRTRAGLFDVLRYNYENLRDLLDDDITTQKINEIDDRDFANKVGIGKRKVLKMLNDTTEDDVEIEDLTELYIKINEDGKSYIIFKNTEDDGVTIDLKEPMVVVDDSVGDIQRLQEELRDLQDELEIEALSKKAFRERRREIRTLLRGGKDVKKLRKDASYYEEREKQLQKINEKEEELSDAITSRFFDIEKELQELRNQKIRRTKFSQRRNTSMNVDVDEEINALEAEKEALKNLNPELYSALDDNFVSDESDDEGDDGNDEDDSGYEDEDAEESRGSSAGEEESEDDADENSSSDDSDLLTNLPPYLKT